MSIEVYTRCKFGMLTLGPEYLSKTIRSGHHEELALGATFDAVVIASVAGEDKGGKIEIRAEQESMRGKRTGHIEQLVKVTLDEDSFFPYRGFTFKGR